MHANPEALHVQVLDLDAVQEAEDRVGPPAEVGLAHLAGVAGSGVRGDGAAHLVGRRLGRLHVARHVARDVRGGKRGVRPLQVAVHAHLHVREVRPLRRDEQLDALVLVARKAHGESVLRDGPGGELPARHDLLHRRSRAEEHGGRRDAGLAAVLEEAHVVAGVVLPVPQIGNLARHRVAPRGDESDQVAPHARAIRRGRRFALLQEGQAVDEHAHVARVGEEEVHAADVGGVARLWPVAEGHDPLGIAARRKVRAGAEAVLDASVGRADEGGEGVVALAHAHEVDDEAVVAAPVAHGGVQVEARPFVEALAPRAALEVEGVLAGGGEGVRHADRAVVRELARGGLPLGVRLEVEEDGGGGCGEGGEHERRKGNPYEFHADSIAHVPRGVSGRPVRGRRKCGRRGPSPRARRGRGPSRLRRCGRGSRA